MNRKLLIPVLAAFLMVVTIMPAASVVEARQQGNVYLALGDSLAVGDGATDFDRLAYVPHLYNFFHGESHGAVDELINLGVGGETTDSFIDGGQLANALQAIAANDVSVVTFDIGGNDFLNLLLNPACQPDPSVPACQQLAAEMIGRFAGNYAFGAIRHGEYFPGILPVLQTALAQKSNPPAPLLVMTYYNPWSGTASPEGQAYERAVNMVLLGADGKIDCGNQAGYGINDIIMCAGTAMGATVADVYPRFVGKGERLTHVNELINGMPNIHPNNAGYAQIAAVFEAAYLGR